MECVWKRRGYVRNPLPSLEGFTGGSNGKSICLQCGRPWFDPWIGKIPWRRKWQPTPVLLPGKSHGQRSLVDYSSWGCKASDMTERLHFLSLSLKEGTRPAPLLTVAKIWQLMAALGPLVFPPWLSLRCGLQKSGNSEKGCQKMYLFLTWTVKVPMAFTMAQW